MGKKKKKYRRIAAMMAYKYSQYIYHKDIYTNCRMCPFYSEYIGLRTAMFELGADFEYYYDDEDDLKEIVCYGKSYSVKKKVRT